MKNRALVGTLATVFVVGMVVAGLFAIGSPSTAREYRADQERRNRLSQLDYVLATHVRSEGSLPEQLEQMDEQALRNAGYGFDARRDPETGDFFEYRRVSERRYEICATFHHASDDRRAQQYGAYPGDISHRPGRNCYTRTITDRDLETAPDFGIGERFPAPEAGPGRLSPVPATTADPGDSPAASPAADV